MCGACGQVRAVDAWSAGLDSRRARWEVASVVDGLLSGARSAARVSATPTGWSVRGATGRTSLVDTLSALWAAVGPLPAGVRPADPGAGATVAAAMHASYRQHLAQHETGGAA